MPRLADLVIPAGEQTSAPVAIPGHAHDLVVYVGAGLDPSLLFILQASPDEGESFYAISDPLKPQARAYPMHNHGYPLLRVVASSPVATATTFHVTAMMP
jgi:hypothetical protein